MAQQAPGEDGGLNGLIHQPASWGEDWLRRLQEPTTEKDLFKETSAMEEFIAQVMKAQQATPLTSLQRTSGNRTLPAPIQPQAAPQPSFQPPQQHASPSSDAPKMDDIWSMLNKPANK
eukprot:scaffold440812_cov46-Prasinocladus_malaysianus.AAC.1